jgi:isovaleryl-CoA dehydrogenase
VFEDCRVPAANLVGKENDGVKIVMSGLDLERAMISPLCLGIAERALELSSTTPDAQAVRQADRLVPDGAVDAGRHVHQVEAMRAHLRTLAEANDLEIGGGGRGHPQADRRVHHVRRRGLCTSVLDKAVQVHGGSGYIWESEINRLFRGIKLLEIGAGTTEVRKMIIAGELLKAR